MTEAFGTPSLLQYERDDGNSDSNWKESFQQDVDTSVLLYIVDVWPWELPSKSLNHILKTHTSDMR